jgi:CRISPR-associated endonuclease Cas1
MASNNISIPAFPARAIQPILPREGVVTLFGYRISVSVDRGHLLLEDGIGLNRRAGRFPRVGHGLRRLIVIGSNGSVSLAAFRWLADQDAAFVMLERDGSVLATTGPVRPSDARLRRAQSLASGSTTGVAIARELIARKLAGQERVIRQNLNQRETADTIAEYHERLKHAATIPEIRLCESFAAAAYWSAWRLVAIKFPEADIARVPLHWQTFGARKSPITNSQRLAVNPLNAMLNYLYAVLESESRLALAALGLDPGIGVIHVDTPSRDSFACDLMEAIRPEVDAYLFDWISQQPLRRSWFFEESDGNCRLMGSFAERLSETADQWGRAIAPVAEWIACKLWSTLRKSSQRTLPPTRLTQTRRREVRELSVSPVTPKPTAVPHLCVKCGATLVRGRAHCFNCSKIVARGNILKAAQLGRIATQSPKAQQLRGETQVRQRQAELRWNPAEKPAWLDKNHYIETILPGLKSITVPTIASRLGVSAPYATQLRKGRIPHPRHWLSLLQLLRTPKF